jgi:putative membrane protein
MLSGFMKNLKKENHTSRLASLYPYIKGLPGRGNLKGLTVMFTTLTIILVSLIDWTIIWLPALSYYSIIMVNYLFSKVGRGLVNFRRLNGLTVMEMMINSVGLTIMHLFNMFTKLPIISLSLLSSFTSLATLLRGLVVRVLAEDDLSFSLRYSITISVFLIAPFFASSLNNLLVPMLIGQITGNVLYTFYSSGINYFFRIHGLKPIKLLSAMLAIFLDGKKDSLENLAEKLNTRSDITIDCLVFREAGRRNVEIAFIIPTFHPGPFRDFGSSILPYLIEEKLSSKGVKTVIARGLSDHSKNIISRKDCEFIAEEISNKIINWDSNYSRRIGLTKVLKHGSATASLIPVGDTTLVVLTLHPKGMEDIPPLLMDGIKRDDIIVVDAHNSFSEDVKELDGDGFRDIRNVLAIASEIIIEKNSQILAGYGENMIEGYGLEDGIGPLGIRVLIFKNENYSTALIVLDSNNAVPEIRERILEDAKNLGIDYCEVLTTDTHIVNGIKLGGRGYHPLGEVIPIEVVSSSVVQALKRAMLNLKEMEVSRVSTTFRSVKVMSNEFLEEASEKTFKSLKLFYITTLLTLITSGLITLSLSLL